MHLELKQAVGHQMHCICCQRRDQLLNLANILLARRCLALPIIEVQLATAISGGHQLTLQIDPPKPCWSKQPVLDDYLLQPLLLVNPENQHDVKFDLKYLHCVSESWPICFLV
jgi:hypothetical protein